MAKGIFKKYRDRANAAGLKKNSEESIKWFRNTLRKGRRVDFNDVRTSATRRWDRRPGAMYTFEYDAKHADKLPYWDKYPLIILADITPDGWYGFNLHYMAPALRAAVMSAIIDGGDKGNAVVDALQGEPAMVNCIKRYLADRVSSRPVLIPRDDWEIAISLPYEGFQKQGQSFVWRDTTRKSRGR